MSQKVIWTPQPGPQTAFIQCPYREVLYGGAAGGGKSDALIGDFASGIEQYGNSWHGVLCRRSFPQLAEIEKRCLEIFSPNYGQSSYKRSIKTWNFDTERGLSTLKLASIDDEIKVIDHQGQQYSWICMDEATQWPSDAVIEYLINRLRSPKEVEGLGKGSPTYIRLTANPGGVGHNWVKDRFNIGVQDDMTPFTVNSSKGHKYERVFIPAKLKDNLILMKNDPMYEAVLDGIADPILRRALRDGDWNIAAGAAFPEFDPVYHVIPDREIPTGVRVWRSMDWGYDKPFSVLWFYADFDGYIYVINEIYGQGAKVNQGLRQSPERVAERIREVEERYGWDVKQAYLDSQCWAQDGGQTLYHLLGGPKMRWSPWPKGAGSRHTQKQVVHQYLQIVNGRPRLQIFGRCKHLIRTMSTIPLDRRDVEDVDTNAEDHAYDALRGGLAQMHPKMRKKTERNFLMSLDDLEQDTVRPGDSVGGYGSW